MSAGTERLAGVSAQEACLEDSARCRLALETALGVPFTETNAIQSYRNGDEIFPPMLEAIASARETVEFLTFIYWTGRIAERFAESLSEKSRAGVKVKVMLDGFGARPMPKHLLEQMSRAGVEVRWFRPAPVWRVWRADNRTHRKVLVVDGVTGFTGGVGIAEEWEGNARDSSEWRDTHFRLVGPAVLGLRSAFYGNWFEAGRTINDAIQHLSAPEAPGNCVIQVVRSSATIGWSDIATLSDVLLLAARRRLRVATPYFVPDGRITERLLDAVGRGVQVEIVIPGPYIDKRVSELAGSREIARLVKGGVRLWRFQPSMFHTKAITVDGILASVGSANLNQRSMLKDDEIAVNVLDADFTAEIDRHFDDDIERCQRDDAADWKSRGPLRRLREFAAELIAPET